MCKGRKVWEKGLVSSNPNTAIGKSNPRIILGCSKKKKKRSSVVQGLSKSDTSLKHMALTLYFYIPSLFSGEEFRQKWKKNHNYLHITPDIPNATLRTLLLQNGKKIVYRNQLLEQKCSKCFATVDTFRNTDKFSFIRKVIGGCSFALQFLNLEISFSYKRMLFQSLRIWKWKQ